MQQVKYWFHSEIHKWIPISADFYKARIFARVLTVWEIYYFLFLLPQDFITSVFKKPYFNLAWKTHLQNHDLFISILKIKIYLKTQRGKPTLYHLKYNSSPSSTSSDIINNAVA